MDCVICGSSNAIEREGEELLHGEAAPMCEACHSICYPTAFTMETLVGAYRRVGSSIVYKRRNWTKEPDSSRWGAALAAALNRDHCTGDGRMQLVDKLTNVLHEVVQHLFENAVSTGPRGYQKVCVTIENCEVSSQDWT